MEHQETEQSPERGPKPQGRNPNRKRHGARNQHKMKSFVRWLRQTFPDSFSPNEVPDNDIASHILDIAGGKGELAARLCMCDSQKVVLVDPRPADVVACFETVVLPRLPKKWQARLEARENSHAFIQETIRRRFRQITKALDASSLDTCDDLRNAIKNSSLLVGMHADGATEAIVDVALQNDKPFVVVPCCVFPNLFQTRLVHELETDRMVPVRSHSQFCKYLLAKDPRLQQFKLPFEGRNTAIFYTGSV
ncbi:predicted protein [Phaeodactylum tricornutum CCAP 1055/1]|jgi:hypothetical protein|uniref:Methyltransferase domain-containing protein n=2 Tax=Phaeodactylum tricornutum TaxID=2850 RepID=B7FTG1_PHATC|nr:predicted protein [Phaeodactylum tricornutum CCAP 1055/1]EEC50960.1 predicted protein [Phaeodactylum tricornutum CCAP 1055/1]|eukprot:XP_002178146.1 predicted protein [Phaeodactylum tricornutum CCAP 1055/1]